MPQNKNLKSIVDLIKRAGPGPLGGLDDNANPSTPPVATEGLEPLTAPAKKQINPSGNSSISSASIKTMQQAILDFKNQISSMGTLSNSQSSASESKGFDPFFDFMTDQYSNKAKTNGNQMYGLDNKSDTYTKDRTGHSNASPYINDVRSLIQTLGVVGRHTATGENIPDGIWGKNTQNALQDLGKLAYTLMQMEKDIKINVGVFDMNAYNKNIENGFKSANKEKYAPLITKQIQDLKKQVATFRAKMVDSGHYGKQAGQEAPFEAKFGGSQTTGAGPASKPLAQTFHDSFGTQTMSVYNPVKGQMENKNMHEVMLQKYEKLKTNPVAQMKTDLDSDTGAPIQFTLADISDLPRFKQKLQSEKIMFQGKPASDTPEGIMKAYETISGQIQPKA